MAPDSSSIDINKSLKNYLQRNESGTSEEKGNLLRSWSLDSWFSRSNENISLEEENSSWLQPAEKDSWCPSLSKKQRIIGFIGCFLMGILCFVLAAFYFPFLLLKARKFCLLYSMGSLFMIGSFSVLWGPSSHIRHVCARERLPFTLIYAGTMFLTLYSALWLKQTLLTAVCFVCQVLALVWYFTSYIPLGQTGLKLFTRVCTSTTKNILPI